MHIVHSHAIVGYALAKRKAKALETVIPEWAGDRGNEIGGQETLKQDTMGFLRMWRSCRDLGAGVGFVDRS